MAYEFPFEGRCKHFMIPQWCAYCAGAPAAPPTKRTLSKKARANMGRRNPFAELKQVAPKRKNVILPVFGYGFDPRAGSFARGQRI